ncbi:hypothetical protein LUZ63_010378 [Rhynchospora breviuscula]|uniref:protein-serine/threonine phosphatase n=1 Tax=Rhynchospora breviuscula TaxID=2022672 RepID=A0A9Q0CH34_9POAL|nr:hypothetical protein LUZ63_010378 [Rhynchospora breviuscula]
MEMGSRPPTAKEIASPSPSIFTIGPPVAPVGACIPSFVPHCRKAVREDGSGDNAMISCHVTSGVGSTAPTDDKPRILAKPPRLPSIPSHADGRFASSTDFDLDFGKVSLMSPTEPQTGYMPVFRSGSWSERGIKSYMEDEHVCIDNLVQHLSAPPSFPAPGAFYGVFDGHCGTDAARFVKSNLLKFIIEDNHFPHSMHKAIRSAFMKADHALADSISLDHNSGTTVLTALIFEKTLLIANLGDCRAVLSKRGKAVDMTKDHKPTCKFEKVRIEKLGGTVFDGYLNGQLSVSRALGDWHMKGGKGSICPLTGEPELHEAILTQEDEFLVIACDGLWDVMSSQCAITMVRKSLMNHNDPVLCSRELVQEALERNSCDNLTVLVICFSPDPPPRIEVPRWKVRKCISMEGVSALQGALDADI